MTDYFGYEVFEHEEGELAELLETVDPIYHKTIACGLAQLGKWYQYVDEGLAKYWVDEWFTVVYGTVLMTEDAIDGRCTPPKSSIKQFRLTDFTLLDVEAKDYRWTNE